MCSMILYPDIYFVLPDPEDRGELHSDSLVAGAMSRALCCILYISVTAFIHIGWGSELSFHCQREPVV